mgnify:CR=1 FL=1
MECTPCYVGHCVTAPQDCRTGAPGGWQKLWFVNRCDIDNLTYETILGTPRTRITQIQLKAGASIKSFAFYRKTGLQFDSNAVDENGFRWDHTATVPVVNRDADTMATLRAMIGAELFLIGLHRDGRYWAAGLGEEGFQLQNWNDTKGRQPADGAVMELVFSLTDIHPQTELLLLDGTTPPDDLEARTDLTRNFLADNTDCGAGVLDLRFTSVPEFGQGAPGEGNAGFSLTRTACAQDVTVSLQSSTFPPGLTLALPVTVPTNDSNFVVPVNYDGTAPAGAYTATLVATAPGCSSATETITVSIVIG